MKNLVAGFILVCLITAQAWAEDPAQEAISSLSTAQTLIKQGNTAKAIEEINFALSKLNEVTASGMLKYIPAPPKGFTLDSKSSQGMSDGAMMVGNAGAEAQYSGENEASVRITIATGGLTGKLGSLASFGAMFGGGGQASGSKSVRIKGFTGTMQFDTEGKSGTLTLQVGQKTSVTIEGSNVDSENVLKSFAELMDLNGLSTAL
jgi:hypothetical protein